MPRIRTVKPEFWEDETVASLTRDARLLFIATWNFADDEGRIMWTPEYLKSRAFMYDDDLPVAEVARLMDELTHALLIIEYRAGTPERRLGMIKNFRRHQVINRPQRSRLPAPLYSDPTCELPVTLATPHTDSTREIAVKSPLHPPESLGQIDSVDQSVNGSVNQSRLEGKGKERTLAGTRSGGDSQRDPLDDVLVAVTAVEKPRRPRPRDPIFDAVVGVCRIDPKDLTTSARGSINTAVRQLRDVGATPGDIVRRARRYRDRYPHTSLTPTALAKHWPALTAAPPTTADSYDPLASARRH